LDHAWWILEIIMGNTLALSHIATSQTSQPMHASQVDIELSWAAHTKPLLCIKRSALRVHTCALRESAGTNNMSCLKMPLTTNVVSGAVAFSSLVAEEGDCTLAASIKSGVLESPSANPQDSRVLFLMERSLELSESNHVWTRNVERRTSKS